MADPEAFRELMLTEDPSFGDVMRCVFGLQTHETRTYLALLGCEDHCTVAELTGELDRDRSNVNRSLNALHEKGLVERNRRLLDSGGHVYQYTAKPLDEARALMHRELDAWAEHVHGVIDEFGDGAME